MFSFGQIGSAAGTLDKPYGVAVNERNEIAVTGSFNNRIQIFCSDGTYLKDRLVKKVINRDNRYMHSLVMQYKSIISLLLVKFMILN